MLAQDRIVGARFDFGGPMGARVDADVDNWLLTAPAANPGMLEMFRLRDRQPAPELVPWAGEFAGKYLLSLVQANRMSDDPRLAEHTRDFIAELASCQAEDGYLGPFPKSTRLLANWDLWGHYHILLGLLAWHEDTGDELALRVARGIGDCVCGAYLDTGKRVIEAGSDEMNMAMLHGLCLLEQRTGEERYLRMAREIERDWERAGDYFRIGRAHLDYHRGPRPRWEALADVQGLLELYRITGETDYRGALAQHWHSIRAHDRHPSGAYSTNEQSVGNPYSAGAIETCCTIAWAALSVDALRAMGDPAIADELELTTWNAILGAQHPSGRWWTYDTPLDGVRKASAHHIVFQARQGTPELNCCSVHGPRGLGLLSEWSVMSREGGLAVSYYGPMTCTASLPDERRVRLTQETTYPADGRVLLRVEPEAISRFPLFLRIPGWSAETAVRVNGEPVSGVTAGSYLRLEREWRTGDTVSLEFDFAPRAWSGELGRTGSAAFYRGPLLLAWDQHWNADEPRSPMEPGALPALDASALTLEPVAPAADAFPPIFLGEARGEDGRSVRLVDYATAGAHGTLSRAWLPAVHPKPAPVYLTRPVRGHRVGPGPIRFVWTGCSGPSERTYALVVARDAGLNDVVARAEGLTRARWVLEEGLPAGTYYWQVTSANPQGSRVSEEGIASFTVDESLPRAVEPKEPEPGATLLEAPLAGAPEPTTGELLTARGVTPTEGPDGAANGALRFDGETSLLVYRLAGFPATEYTFHAWIRPEGLPWEAHLGQIAAAWCRPMDDPLRLCIVGGELFGRIEAMGGYGTPGARVGEGEWVHVALVKEGVSLRVYVNGAQVAASHAPEEPLTASEDLGIGGNPHYGGNETFRGSIARVALVARALSAEEIRATAATG